MKILYIGSDDLCEFNEVSALVEAGHTVFSLGKRLKKEHLDKYEVAGYTYDIPLIRDFNQAHPKYSPGGLIKVQEAFAAKFDLILIADQLQNLSLNQKVHKTTKVLWISRTARKGKISGRAEQALLASVRTKGIRYISSPKTHAFDKEAFLSSLPL